LKNKIVKPEFIGDFPDTQNRIALLVPQFNEDSNCNLENRLKYFMNIAETYKDYMDVVIIDDGSTDDSLEKIKLFLDQNPKSFFAASVNPNGQKVGALFSVSKVISHDFVILTDFDTDIVGFHEAFKVINEMESNVMGCYFKMIPFEGSGFVFNWQKLEYSLARSLYFFHRKDLSVPVMPGAGSCFRRDILNTIYSNHSGLRNGEDREATVIGLKLGYKVIYVDSVLTLTRPPLTLRKLIKQRVRWNLGYIETLAKESGYYNSQMLKLNILGVRVILDFITVLFIIFLPLTLLIIATININYFLSMTLIIYLFGFFSCASFVLFSSNELSEHKKKLTTILSFPIVKILVDCIAWTRAILSFLKNNRMAKALNESVL